MNRTVLVIFGTRPEAIKMAPVLSELQKRRVNLKICTTGQHRELLEQMLQAFSIVPDVRLDLMEPGQTAAGFTAKALAALEPILRRIAPALTLVHGDTASALAGALASYDAKIPVAHVEAGLRSGNRYAPHPEEMNRRLVDTLSDFCFAPTAAARENLRREGKSNEAIFVTGNTAVDVLRLTQAAKLETPLADWAAQGKFLLLTLHRRENCGEPARAIFRAIRRLALAHPEVRVICPVHPNPSVAGDARANLGGCENIRLVEPLSVAEFHGLLRRAHFVLTDSGGVQEEAAFLGKPTMVLRTVTERPEGVVAGPLLLAGTGEWEIFRLAEQLLADQSAYAALCRPTDAYGDGFAGRRIADWVEGWLSQAGVGSEG